MLAVVEIACRSRGSHEHAQVAQGVWDGRLHWRLLSLGMSLPPISYKRHRFPPQIIAHAVWLYFRFPLSLRLVEEMRVLRRMECPHRRTKAHYLNCHTGLGIGHSLMPLVLGFHEPRNHPHVLHYACGYKFANDGRCRRRSG
jgi:hypothetical protein